MFIFVGLGNPGRRYQNTRHNVGYEVIDTLASRYHIDVGTCRFHGLVGKGNIEGHAVVLAKPLTYMNLSGQCVRELAHFYKIEAASELIVIYDDVSLSPGQLRIREKGSAGGHNGIKSILSQLGGDAFLRIKVGIGAKPPEYDLADYVLGTFSRQERQLMDGAIARAADAAASLLTKGAAWAMNEYNRKESL